MADAAPWSASPKRRCLSCCSATRHAYVLFDQLIDRIGPTRTVSVTFLIPAFGVLWRALFLGEPVTAAPLLGCATILAGTALASGLLPRRPRAHTPSRPRP